MQPQEIFLKRTATDRDDNRPRVLKRRAIVATVVLVLAGTLVTVGGFVLRDQSPRFQLVEAVETALRDAGIPCRDVPAKQNSALPFASERGSCTFLSGGTFPVHLTIYIIDPSDGDRARIALNNLGFDWYVNGSVAIGPLGPGTTQVIHVLDG
jgi:hypothetical protein